MSRLRLLAALLLIGSLAACSVLPKSQVLSIYLPAACPAMTPAPIGRCG